MRVLVWIAAVWLLLGAQGAPVGAQPAVRPKVGLSGLAVGQAAPDFTRVGLHREPVKLRALLGRVVLLNFWASWCAPCLEEMPRFVAWQRQFGPTGLSVVGISMDDEAGPVVALEPRLHWNYPIAVGDEALGKLYGGVLGLPVTYLIDRRGRVRARYEGASDLPRMEDRVRKLLAEPSR
jgi:peroxiredoxin